MSEQQLETATEIVLEPDDTKKLVDVLHSQHALMGIFGNVFERLGGEQFIYEWAEDNPTKYITLLTHMVPNLAPTQGLSGDINIRISSDLPRSALDD
jgi:hypothetical protein